MTPQVNVMRVMKWSFIVFGLLQSFVVVRIPSTASEVPNATFEVVLTVIAVTNLVVAFAGRRFFEKLTPKTTSGAAPTGVVRWRMGNVAGLALIESCLLFGFVLHMVGGSNRLAYLLCGGAMISFILWSPGKPPEVINIVRR